jgi:hypothetical protein
VHEKRDDCNVRGKISNVPKGGCIPIRKFHAYGYELFDKLENTKVVFPWRDFMNNCMQLLLSDAQNGA